MSRGSGQALGAGELLIPASGSGAEPCQVNHSFPIPPFWWSRRHLPLPTKGIRGALLGRDVTPSHPSSRFPCCLWPARLAEQSPMAQSNTSLASATDPICLWARTGPSPHPQRPEQTLLLLARPVGEIPRLFARAECRRAACGSLSSSAACIKTIKINRIMHINPPLFLLDTEEEPKHR